MRKLILATIFLTTFLSSCEEFLEEEQVATQTYDYYVTEQGMEDLIKSAYHRLRYKVGYEQCYALFNFGTDEYTQSDQLGWRYYNEYGTELNPDQAFLHDLWSYNFEGINRCNLGIESIPNITDGIDFLKDEKGKTIRLAELRFLRAYFYFELIQQFGGVPLKDEATIGVELEFPRASLEENYKLIVRDLRFAVENLPETQKDYGRATANAARHYLAKVYLTRGSAISDQRGQKDTDMDSAAFFADKCIKSGYNGLLDNYADLWDNNNQENKEIVFATMFTTEVTLIGGRGVGANNRSHLFWLNRYDNEPGMKRAIEYGRPYRRLMPTDYAYDIHDRLNDSRLRKSLFTVFYCNNESNIPTWTKPELAKAWNTTITSDTAFALKENGDTVFSNANKFNFGDTALVFLVNDKNTGLTDIDILKMGYTVYARYYWTTDNTGNPVELVEGFVSGKAPSLKKYIDTQRASYNDSKGTRDVFNARLSETYLIAAEAYGRMGNYGVALERINKVRHRAAYKENEPRTNFWTKFDGGNLNDLSSSVDAMIATEKHFSSTDNEFTERELYPPSATSQKDRFIHFILNERCRELLGEMHRWEDLARTETLYERAMEYNPDTKLAGTMREHHKLRPIPQAHLERIFSEGSPLTPAERAAQQNPGY